MIAWGLVGLIPVIATHSRMGMIVCVFQFFVALVFVLKDNAVSKKIITGIIILVVALSVFYVMANFTNIQSLMIAFLYSRGGSNATRLKIYRNSIERVMNDSPFFGMGIKYMLTVRYPYGSHSTYIGVLYKVGIIGMLFFTIGFISLYRNTWKRLSASKVGRTSYLMLLAYLFFLITSDIDTTDWVIVLFFLAMGILNNPLIDVEIG